MGSPSVHGDRFGSVADDYADIGLTSRRLVSTGWWP